MYRCAVAVSAAQTLQFWGKNRASSGCDTEQWLSRHLKKKQTKNKIIQCEHLFTHRSECVCVCVCTDWLQILAKARDLAIERGTSENAENKCEK